MPSGWDVYYVVFLSALLALGIPATLWLISFLFFTGSKTRRAGMTPPRTLLVGQARETNQTVLGSRINARFFLAANAALILITLVLALIPCAGTLQGGRSDVARGLVAIVTIAGLAALGLLYSARKGDLGWLRSFQSEVEKEGANEK